MTENRVPIGLRKPWQWIQPKGTTELINRLIEARDFNVHERERENLCSVAAGKIEDMDNENSRLRSELEAVASSGRIWSAKLTAMTKWLDENQHDVWRRGLWDAIALAARGKKP